MNVIIMILGILKIVFLVFLILLFVCIVLLCLLLFGPIHYILEGEVASGVDGKFLCSWFWKVVQFSYVQGHQENKKELKILGFKIEKKPKIKKISKNKIQTDETKEKDKYDTVMVESSKKESDSDVQVEKVAQQVLEEKVEPLEQEWEEPDESFEYDRKDDEKINSFIENLKEKWETVQEKFEQLKMWIHYPDKKQIIDLTLLLIKKEWKAIKPSCFYLSGEIGFEEPSQTGIALGGLGLLMGITGWDIRIKGNFEKQVMQVALFTKGKTNCFRIFFPIIIYVLQKPIWKICKMFLFRKDDLSEYGF